jgi:hypothetical protein
MMDRQLLRNQLFTMQRSVLSVVAFGLVLALAGCITPSIPIPPPDPALMTFMLQGDVGNHSASFTYPANANYSDSVVFVYNRDRGTGIIEDARPDGSVGPTVPVRAELGDQIVVSFQREDQSSSRCIRLREGAQNGLDYCDP